MIKVDVLIPAYKPSKEFDLLLTRLEKQTIKPNKILVINTEKKYWDESLEEKHPIMKVFHISQEEFDHGATRRRLAEKSQADIFVCMTQDALPADHNLLENLVKALQQDEVKSAYARQIPRADCHLAETFTRSFNYPKISRIKKEADLQELGIKAFFCSNVCAAYDKKTYEELGGFPTKTIFNEDMIYARKVLKAGYGIAYAADAKVIHSHNYSCMEQLKRNFDLGVSQAEYKETFQGIPSESEGIRMVKKTIEYLGKEKKWFYIPGVILQSGCKYIGYRLGKNHEKLPMCVIKKITMNRNYWK